MRPLGLLAAFLTISLGSSAYAAGPHGYSVIDGELLRIDLSDGSFEVIGPTGVGNGLIQALAEGSGNFVYGIGPDDNLDSQLYRFDVMSGQGELIGEVEVPNGVQAPRATLDFLPDGFLYAFGPQGGLYRIDPDTAEATLVRGLGPLSVSAATAIGSQLYVFYYESEDCMYGRIDTQSLNFHSIGLGADCPGSAAVTADGRIILVNYSFDIFLPDTYFDVSEFDPATANSRLIGSWSVTPGDPSTKMLLGLAGVEGAPAVDVPATNFLGRVLFVVGLALTALFLLHTTNVSRN
jgi:hypothetical protein